MNRKQKILRTIAYVKLRLCDDAVRAMEHSNFEAMAAALCHMDDTGLEPKRVSEVECVVTYLMESLGRQIARDYDPKCHSWYTQLGRVRVQIDVPINEAIEVSWFVAPLISNNKIYNWRKLTKKERQFMKHFEPES